MQHHTQVAAGGETQMGGGENLDVNNFGLVPRRAGAERAPEALRKSDGGAVAGNGFAQSQQMAQSDPRPQLCQAFVTVKSIALGDTFSARLAGPNVELQISGAVFTQGVAVGEVFRIDLHRLDEEAARLVTEEMAQSEPEDALQDLAAGNFDFGAALSYLKMGRRVARRGWNGKGMWLVLVPGTPNAVLHPGTPYARALAQPSCNILPHIDMWTVDASGRRAMLPGWLASQTDMLSDDWVLLREEIEASSPSTNPVTHAWRGRGRARDPEARGSARLLSAPPEGCLSCLPVSTTVPTLRRCCRRT